MQPQPGHRGALSRADLRGQRGALSPAPAGNREDERPNAEEGRRWMEREREREREIG